MRKNIEMIKCVYVLMSTCLFSFQEHFKSDLTDLPLVVVNILSIVLAGEVNFTLSFSFAFVCLFLHFTTSGQKLCRVERPLISLSFDDLV